VEIELTPRTGYLHVSVANRGGLEDAKDVLQRLVAAVQVGEHRRLLISVRQSPAIFRVEGYGLSDALTRAAGVPGLRVALVADTAELFASYQYVELLAAQKGLAAKAFRGEAEATVWLLASSG
jgi:hypothetical protein